MLHLHLHNCDIVQFESVAVAPIFSVTVTPIILTVTPIILTPKKVPISQSVDTKKWCHCDTLFFAVYTCGSNKFNIYSF